MSQAMLVFTAVLITSFIGPFMGSAVNLALPAIGAEFGVAPVHLGWVVSAYLLGSVAVLLPAGKLSDIYGRRKIYLFGVVSLLFCTVFAGIAQSACLLIVWRFLQGMATAMIFSTGMTMIILVHPPEERGKAIGCSAAATYIGLSLGPVLGGVITHYFGWRGIFYLTALVLSLGLWLTTKVKAEWYGARGEAFDYKGSFFYFVAGLGILYGCSRLADDAFAVYILGTGLCFFGLFIWQQGQSASPLLDLALFRKNTVFAMSNLAAMINYSATFAIGFSLSLYLQLIRGFDAPAAGMVLLIQPCIMALFSPAAGALSDKMEPRLVASVGMALNAAGLAAFSFIGAHTPIWLIGLNFAVIGLGFALFSSPNNNAIMGAVPARHYGVAASVLAVMRLMGQALSMAIVTLGLSICAVDAVSASYLDSLPGALSRTFSVFALLCAAGVAASLARGKNACGGGD